MNDILSHLLEYIAGAAIVGLIVWVWVLWLSHMNHKVEVAKTFALYIQRADMTDLDAKYTRIDNALQDIVKIVYQLKGRAQGPHHDG